MTERQRAGAGNVTRDGWGISVLKMNYAEFIDISAECKNPGNRSVFTTLNVRKYQLYRSARPKRLFHPLWKLHTRAHAMSAAACTLKDLAYCFYRLRKREEKFLYNKTREAALTHRVCIHLIYTHPPRCRGFLPAGLVIFNELLFRH